MNIKPSIKLNLGCGPSGLEGWLNYDWGILPLLSKFPWARRALIRMEMLAREYDVPWPPIQLVDIRKRFPLEDGRVQFIYCSHVLEHFERWETLHILREARRVMSAGGRIRAVVPDLKKMSLTYLGAIQDPTMSPQTRPSREMCRLLWGYSKDIEPSSFWTRWSRKFIRDHQWAYDSDEMTLLLEEAGFEKIRICAYRQGEVPDVEKLDLESHSPHSLYMEAGKKE